MEHGPHEDDIFYDAYGMKVWQRRHQWIASILTLENKKKVVDFGCCEGKFLDRLTASDHFELLVGIDIDQQALDEAASLLQVQDMKYSARLKRPYPLNVKIYEGSVFERYEELKQYEFEVCTLIEVIEHVQKEQLSQIEENVFGYLNIPTVIITTPNSEFNVFFPFYKENPDQLRHWDHKYEFTQKEFNDWCYNICKKYDYTVEIGGVGDKKDGDMSRGWCSQTAIFRRINKYSEIEFETTNNFPLTLVKNYIYPDNKVDPEKELKIFIEQQYRQILFFFFSLNINTITLSIEFIWVYNIGCPSNKNHLNLIKYIYHYEPEKFIDQIQNEQTYSEEREYFLEIKFLMEQGQISQNKLMQESQDNLVAFIKKHKEYVLNKGENKIQIKYIINQYESEESEEQSENY